MNEEDQLTDDLIMAFCGKAQSAMYDYCKEWGYKPSIIVAEICYKNLGVKELNGLPVFYTHGRIGVIAY